MPDSGRTLPQRLLLLARDAHAGGHHEAAYHALAAALHAAQDAGERPTVQEVGREAAAQAAWLDQHLPEHRISTRTAEAHGRPAAYQLLIQQAKAWLAATPSPPGSRGAGSPARGG